MQFKTFDIIPHDTKFDFVGKRHIAVALSLIANLAVILWALPWIHGLNLGVDFAGGTEMEVQFQQAVDPSDIRKGLEELQFKDASVQTYGPEAEHTYLIRVGRVALLTPEKFKQVVAAVRAKLPVQGEPGFDPEVGDKLDFEFPGALPEDKEARQKLVDERGGELKAAIQGAGVDVQVREVRAGPGLTPATTSFTVITQGIQDRVAKDLAQRFAAARPEVRRVEYVGPAVGRELAVQGLKAILFAMALIVVYVGLRFDFKFGPGVIIALLHDAIITLGYFAFSGREFNLTAVAVILTVVGYSVNDTVVVYDRIRENQGKYKGKHLADLVNLSINEVLGRTFLTSFATALSLIGLLVYGVGTIFDFSAAMLIGIISGTYSTWFIAAPMTIWLEERAERKAQHPAQAARVAR